MAKDSATRDRFSLADFGLRLLGATILVMATYNPEYSYVDWVSSTLEIGSIGPEHHFVGVVLLIGWVILLRATFNSLGMLGLVLGGALRAPWCEC